MHNHYQDIQKIDTTMILNDASEMVMSFSEKVSLVFEDVSYECLRQNAFSSKFLSSAKIMSGHVPFWCDECDDEILVEIRKGADRETFLGEADKLRCQHCNGPVVAEEDTVLESALDLLCKPSS